MAKEREIRCYDYVNRPYDEVREILKADALSVFQAATKAAAARAQDVAAALHVNVAGLEISTEITITIEKIEERPGKLKLPRSTHLELEWESTRAPNLFPFMRADLSIYPLTATETQLDLRGLYQPPLGVLGSAINSVVGYRVAEASVHHFVSDLAAFLRSSMTADSDTRAKSKPA